MTYFPFLGELALLGSPNMTWFRHEINLSENSSKNPAEKSVCWVTCLTIVTELLVYVSSVCVLNPSIPTWASQISATWHKTRPHLPSVWFENYYTTLACWTNTNSSTYLHPPSAPPFVWWYTLPPNLNYCYHNPGQGTAPACRRVRRREQRKAEDCDRKQMT